jgi:DNA-binding NarL/FixJ family response regulator
MSPELLELVRSGLKDKLVAEMFGCSEKTILRRRLEVKPEVRAAMRATSDESVKDVCVICLSFLWYPAGGRHR